eukprot:jgi/Chlat1/5334/Chrsp35S05266
MSSSLSPPVALVCGGTGLQGSSCIEQLLQSRTEAGQRKWAVRTLTRNANSRAAADLKAKGVEVYEANLLDPVPVMKAMEGVHSLFAITFSDHDGTEFQQGKVLAECALRAKVQRVVFSGGERINVPSMDNKADIEGMWQTMPFPWIVYLHSSFFYENVATKRGTKRVLVNKERTEYRFSIPLLKDVPIPFMSSRDIGTMAAFILNNPDKFLSGQELRAAGDIISPQQYVETFSKVTGKKAKYEQLSLEFFARLPIPGAEKIVEMYHWYHKGCPGHVRDPKATKQLNPQVMNCEEWMRRYGADLIEKMAYTDGWMNSFHNAFLWIMIQLFGSWLKLRGFLLSYWPTKMAKAQVVDDNDY